MMIRGLRTPVRFGAILILSAVSFFLILFVPQPETRGEGWSGQHVAGTAIVKAGQASEWTPWPGPEKGQSPASQTGGTYQAIQPGSATSGEALFVGRIPFKNGGPACASCHSVAGIPFPNGGRLGPDLSGTYAKFGSEGTDFALQTLFFPTMTPIFGARPLTIEEQRDLKAFLQQTRPGASVQIITLIIFSIAFLGYLALMILSWILWRHRLGAVRRSLLRKAMSTGGLQS